MKISSSLTAQLMAGIFAFVASFATIGISGSTITALTYIKRTDTILMLLNLLLLLMIVFVLFPPRYWTAV